MAEHTASVMPNALAKYIHFLRLSTGYSPTTFPVCPLIAKLYILSRYFILSIHTGSNEYLTLPFSKLIFDCTGWTDEYPDVVSGLSYCKRCHSPRRTRQVLFGKERILPIVCRCRMEDAAFVQSGGTNGNKQRQNFSFKT